MITIKTMVRNRRIDVPVPTDIPDGAEVTLTIVENHNNENLSPAEIVRIQAAMQKLEAWDIPATE